MLRIGFVGLLTVIVMLGPGASRVGAQDHLAVKGDPAQDLELAKGWSPAPVVRDAEGRIKSAPFWSSHWKKSGELLPDAEVPAPPIMLLKQEPDRVLAWGVKEYKLKPVIIATPHAILYIALPKQPAKVMSAEEKEWLQAQFPKKLKSKLTPVQVAHLYGLRYLKIEAMFEDLLCLNEKAEDYRPGRFGGGAHYGSKGRSELYVFPEEDPYREFGRHFFGVAGAHASYWWHSETETIIGAFHSEGLKPDEVNGRFHHLVAHDLVYQYRAFYHYIPAWIPNGVAHHFARRTGKVKNTYMILGGADKRYKDAWEWDKKGTKQDWWREAKILVKSGSARALTQLGLQTHYQELDPRYHVQAWSMINYIIGMGKGRFRTFLDEIMDKKDDDSILQVQQRALLRACGVNMVQFERHWKEWVGRTKPPKRRRRGG